MQEDAPPELLSIDELEAAAEAERTAAEGVGAEGEEDKEWEKL